MLRSLRHEIMHQYRYQASEPLTKLLGLNSNFTVEFIYDDINARRYFTIHESSKNLVWQIYLDPYMWSNLTSTFADIQLRSIRCLADAINQCVQRLQVVERGGYD